MANRTSNKSKVDSTADKPSTRRRASVANPYNSTAYPYSKQYGNLSNPTRSARSTETFLLSLMKQGQAQGDEDGFNHTLRTVADFLVDNSSFFSKDKFELNLTQLTEYLQSTHEESVNAWNQEVFNAVNNNDLSVIQTLVKTNGFNINSEIKTIETDRGINGIKHLPVKAHTALTWASWKGQTTLVKRLLKIKADLNAMTSQGLSAIHFGSMTSTSLPSLKALLENTENTPNVNICDDKDATTPLMYACGYGLYTTVKYLLTRNAEVNQQDGEGKSALFYAVIGGHLNLIKLLVAHDACVYLRDNSNACLLHHLIASHRNMTSKTLKDILIYLVGTRTLDVTLQQNIANTPLHVACQLGLHDVAQFLMNRGASTEVKKNGWETVIWTAVTARYPSIPVVTLLFENGADFNQTNCFGDTLIEFVAKTSKDKLLMETLQKLQKEKKNRRMQKMKDERRRILGCLVDTNPGPKPIASRTRTKCLIKKMKQEPADEPNPHNTEEKVDTKNEEIPPEDNNNVPLGQLEMNVLPTIKQKRFDKQRAVIKTEPCDCPIGYVIDEANLGNIIEVSTTISKENSDEEASEKYRLKRDSESDSDEVQFELQVKRCKRIIPPEEYVHVSDDSD